LFFSFVLFANQWTQNPLDYIPAIPDSFAARKAYADLLQAPLNELKNYKPKKVQDLTSGRWMSFSIDEGSKTELVYLYVFDKKTNPGSTAVYRNRATGQLQRMEVVLRQNPGIILRFEAEGDRSRASIIYGENEYYLYRRVKVSLSLDRLVRLPLSTIMDTGAGRFDWGSFLARPDASYYKPVQYMVDQIRKNLPNLPDDEDGAPDEEGYLTKISDLSRGTVKGMNCSGFAKWIADGLYRAVKGRGMNINDLKEVHYGLRGSGFASAYEELRQPYFGLDWLRNIACEVFEARTNRKLDSYEARDVRGLQFVPYLEDKGFTLGDLELALFTLALKEPGNFYFASVNGEWGSNPTLWQHYHVIAFFPYLDEQGAFQIAVFERNTESSMASVKRRYPNEYFHLVKMVASEEFEIKPVLW